MSPAPQKDVIYIDIDDEITSIIDKIRSSNSRLVALVLPKRATMLQSSVNMKLLKKAGDSAKKHVVLITSEAGLLPLAGSIGLYVAKNLQSKPEIPDVPASESAVKAIDTLEEAEDETFDPRDASDKPVGDLADSATKKPKAALEPRPIPLADESDEAIELPATSSTPESGKKAKKGGKGDKKLRIPNFEKFRLRLILGAVALILLITGWIFANSILPKATIAIKTDTSTKNANINLELSTTAKSVDPGKNLLPAQIQQTQKTQTQQAEATGQKNQGSTASGSVSMTAQACAPNIPGKLPDVPAGTGVSVNGLTYITKDNTSFKITGGQGSCVNYEANNATAITAQSPGAKYNVDGGTSFTVASRSEVSAKGGASGGTDDIVKTVSQADVASAQQKLSAQDTTSIRNSLADTLTAAGMYPLRSTFNAGTPNATTNVNVGDRADSVTVTQTTTYTMFGVREQELRDMLRNALEGGIDTDKQSVLDDGLNKAAFTVVGQTGNSAQVALRATGTVGPKIDVNTLKTQIMGKKSSEVKRIIGSNPGVIDVEVSLSPFWVETVPKKNDKITITFEKSNSTNADKR